MSAERLFDAGYTRIIPVAYPGAKLAPGSKLETAQLGKAPARLGVNGWSGFPNWRASSPIRADALRYDSWGANVGLLADHFPALDIDCDSRALSALITDFAHRNLGDAPVRLSREPRRLLVYRADIPFTKMALVATYNGRSHAVEFLGAGQQFLVYGKHPSGAGYRWIDAPLWEIPPDNLTPITLERVVTFFNELAEVLEARGLEVKLKGDGLTREAKAPPQEHLRAPSIELLREVVNRIPNNIASAPDWDSYIKYGHAIRAAAGDAEAEGLEIYQSWVERCERVTPDVDDAAQHWERMHAPHRVGYSWLAEMAEAFGGYVSAQDEFEADADAPPPAGNTAQPPLILDAAQPYATAGELLNRNFTRDGIRTLHSQGGAIYAFDGAAFREAEDGGLRSDIYRFTEGAHAPVKGGAALVPFSPTAAKVNNILDALHAKAHLPATYEPPCFLDPQPGDPPAHEIISVQNGLLHVPTRTLYPHSPRFYTHNALDFEFDVSARGEPTRWLAFLRQIWPDDAECLCTLQEIFGYLLLGDTSQQKMFLWVAPKRGGKGTVARVLTELLGRANVCSPTLQGLSTQFGLEALIGKLLATVTDARLSGRTDPSVIAERMLSVTGEDSVSIDRKYRSAWTGRLPTRFFIFTNELPTSFSDASGALPSRFILLTSEASFYGQEDLRLTEKLLEELPLIFAWALDGLDRLRERGHFVQPASSRDALRDLEEASSPVAAFVSARCVIEASGKVPRAELFAAWREWCGERGLPAGNANTFGRNLRASGLKLHLSQSHGGERHYGGITLLPGADPRFEVLP